MSKVLLISPFGKQVKEREDHPMGLLYIGSYLQKYNHTVNICDMTLESEDVIAKIRSFQPDYVGIQVMTTERFVVFDLCKKIKSISPDILIILGGSHVLTTSREILENYYSYVDIIVRGYGEEPMAKIVDGIKLDDIHGISYFDDNKRYHENPINSNLDYDSLPIADYTLFNLNKYRLYVGDKLSLPLFTSLGCPFKCVFCAAGSMSQTVRFFQFHTIKKTIELIKELGFNAITIQDDTFGMNKEIAVKIMEKIKKMGMLCKIKTRLNLLDKDFLEFLKGHNCLGFHFGIESASPKVRKIIGKKINLDKAVEIAKISNRLKFDSYAFYMIGNPGENRNDALLTISFSKKLRKLGIKDSYATGVYVFPGTKLERIARSEGVLPDNFNWTSPYQEQRNLLLDYSPFVPIYESMELKIEDIYELKCELLSSGLFYEKVRHNVASLLSQKIRINVKRTWLFKYMEIWILKK
ncbi:MAG: B12-binding domain-containing radical SAM protein [Candidatus Scalindua sediminis]|nr:B12-binding domain-containing radical SAM protein [Candidatus Scalindua sediminis]